MSDLYANKLSKSRKKAQRYLIAISVIAYFAFADFSIYVYIIKSSAILGLILLAKTIRNDSYLQWILFFSAWSFFSISWAIESNIVFSYFIWYLQAVLLAYAIGTTILCYEDFDFILKCILVGGTLLSIRALYSIPFENLGKVRIGSNIGYNENEMALKASLAAIAAFYFLCQSKKLKYKILLIMAMALSSLTVAFSGSRKGLIMLLVSVLLFCLINTKNPKKFLRNAAISVAFVYLLLYAINNIELLYNSFGRRFLLLFNIFDEGAYVGNSITNRMNDIDIGFEAFTYSPICGYGLGNYMFATGQNGYAHNNYIQLLVDLGIAGIILYYWFYIKVGYGLITTLRLKKREASLCLSMLTGIIIIETGLVSFNSDYIQLIIMLCFYVVKLSKKTNIEDREKEKLLRGVYSI